MRSIDSIPKGSLEQFPDLVEAQPGIDGKLEHDAALLATEIAGEEYGAGVGAGGAGAGYRTGGRDGGDALAEEVGCGRAGAGGELGCACTEDDEAPERG